MQFVTRSVLFIVIVLICRPGGAQTQIGFKAGVSKSQFFYKVSKFDQLLYEDDTTYHYETSFTDALGPQGAFFIRARKGNWTFSGMAMYQQRTTTSTETYHYYDATGSYDPFFTMADTIEDSRAVQAKFHGIYLAVMPGLEFGIGEVNLFFDAGLYLGYIFSSSTSSTGTQRISNDGTSTTQTWQDQVSANALNTPDMGIMAGAGFSFPLFSSLRLRTDFQLSKGFSDLGSGDFGEYGIGRINSVNMGFNLGLAWQFEKTTPAE